MALDSATKRQAIPGVGRPWMRVKKTDSGVGRAWRASVAHSYPVADFAGGLANKRPIAPWVKAKRQMKKGTRI